MHRLLLLVVVLGCGGSSPAPVQPVPPEPTTAVSEPAPPPPQDKPVEQVAIGGTGDDPCDGGEQRADPCAGGEVVGGGGIGQGGLGMRGTGEGGAGGGTGAGRGLGSIGTIGSGSGTGTGYGGAPGHGGPVVQRKHPMPKVVFGKPVITGALSGDVIRRVFQRGKNQLTYCYERVLHNNPDLGGKLVAEFVITPSGTVGTAKATGVAPDVEGCVQGRIITWTFPKPRKGIVKVTFPMTFSYPK